MCSRVTACNSPSTLSYASLQGPVYTFGPSRSNVPRPFGLARPETVTWNKVFIQAPNPFDRKSTLKAISPSKKSPPPRGAHDEHDDWDEPNAPHAASRLLHSHSAATLQSPAAKSGSPPSKLAPGGQLSHSRSTPDHLGHRRSSPNESPNAHSPPSQLRHASVGRRPAPKLAPLDASFPAKPSPPARPSPPTKFSPEAISQVYSRVEHVRLPSSRGAPAAVRASGAAPAGAPSHASAPPITAIPSAAAAASPTAAPSAAAALPAVAVSPLAAAPDIGRSV